MRTFAVAEVFSAHHVDQIGHRLERCVYTH